MDKEKLGIDVYEDQQTGEAIITLGEQFDSSVIAEFREIFSQYEQDRRFLINLKYVENFGFSSLTTLLLLDGYVGDDKSRISVTRCPHHAIDEAIKFPLFKPALVPHVIG